MPKEQPGQPWYRAAQYEGAEPAGRAYTEARDTIFASKEDLAAYRMMLEEIWHVAVLGGTPASEAFEQQIEQILFAEGTPTELPQEAVVYLAQRHQAAAPLGPKVELHHRPGKRVKIRKR